MAKLVDAMHILCSSSISPEKLICAKRLLLSFTDEFENLYGQENMVYNVHQLRHLSDCVELNGPLFAYSNYCMEDNIGHIVEFVKGTTDVTKQVCTKYLLEKNLHKCLEKSERARNFYNRIESKLSFSVTINIGDSLLIGKPRKHSNLNANELTLIKNIARIGEDDEILEYNSIFLKRKIFYETVANATGKRTNDSFIYNQQTQRFGEIKSIVLVRERIFLLINEKFELENDHGICKYSIFLLNVENFGTTIIEPESIGSKYIFFQYGSTLVCSSFPNFYERN